MHEINRNPNLLPNISLGYLLYNSYSSEERTLEHYLRWLSGTDEVVPNYNCRERERFVAAIGGATSALSVQMGTLLDLYHLLQLHSYLKNTQFKNIVGEQVFVDENRQADTCSESHHIILICNEGSAFAFYCVLGYMGFLGLGSFTIAFLARNLPDAFNEAKFITFSMLVFCSVWISFLPTYQSSKGKAVMIVEIFSIMLPGSGQDCYEDQPMRYIRGDVEIGLFLPLQSPEVSNVTGAERFQRPPNKACRTYTYNEKNYQQYIMPAFTLHEINRNPNLLPNISLGYRIYNSYSSEERTLENYLRLLSGTHQPLPNYNCREPGKVVAAIGGATSTLSVQMGSLLDLYRLPQMHSYLKNTQFKNSVGEQVFVDENRRTEAQYAIMNYVPSAVCSASCPAGFRKLPLEGKPPCCFSCSPCLEGEISSHKNAEQCKKCPEDEYPNEQRDRCLPKIVTFLDVNDPWGKAVTAVALSLSFFTALVLWVFVKFQDTPIVQANNRNLSYLLLTSLSTCFLCSLLFVGRPTTASCLFRQTVFAVVFTVAVSSILAKTVIVVLAFRVTGPGSRMRIFLHPRVPYCVVLICSGIQGLFCAIWLGTSPPFPEADTHSESHHIILTCNEGSAFAFYCVLGYMGFLALGSFTIAFLARNLPDAFNEAKFITFSMLVFCSVWISFLPTYQSSKGKALMIVEIFSILASSAGLLGCIFIPKCLVILLIYWENTIKQNKNQRSSRIGGAGIHTGTQLDRDLNAIAEERGLLLRCQRTIDFGSTMESPGPLSHRPPLFCLRLDQIMDLEPGALRGCGAQKAPAQNDSSEFTQSGKQKSLFITASHECSPTCDLEIRAWASVDRQAVSGAEKFLLSP
ncbi:vomeronasal type-2 receptor 26-like [Sminthopsis crassicaudata]|uniref:vomeronasal type-2 receptor 26-like n=1 Tax=Sminthopsis crassicaudata TaxID=9301 RepID=UPI003D68D310